MVAGRVRPGHLSSRCAGAPLSSSLPDHRNEAEVLETSFLTPVRPTEGRELSVRVTGGSPYPIHTVPASTMGGKPAKYRMKTKA